MANVTGLKGFDDLFKSSEQREENHLKVVNGATSLPLSKLKSFSKHPFKIHGEVKMQELADSILENGVITPILVRPIEDDKYSFEIIAGHNRVEASKLAGLDIIPCDVRELDDDTATIIMIDSNLQREKVFPSEKAWAYKYKLDALKSQGKRKDLTSTQFAWKSETADVVGKESDESGDTVRRYIRLTKLIFPLLNKVDEKKLAFIPSVELSYLSKQEQKWLYNNLEREEYFGVSLALARKLKGISKNGKLTEEKIDKLIVQKVQTPPKSVKISRTIFRLILRHRNMNR